jgi:hypothetical protein
MTSEEIVPALLCTYVLRGAASFWAPADSVTPPAAVSISWRPPRRYEENDRVDCGRSQGPCPRGHARRCLTGRNASLRSRLADVASPYSAYLNQRERRPVRFARYVSQAQASLCSASAVLFALWPLSTG